jgi:hypothetical protein
MEYIANNSEAIVSIATTVHRPEMMGVYVGGFSAQARKMGLRHISKEPKDSWFYEENIQRLPGHEMKACRLIGHCPDTVFHMLVHMLEGCISRMRHAHIPEELQYNEHEEEGESIEASSHPSNGPRSPTIIDSEDDLPLGVIVQPDA